MDRSSSDTTGNGAASDSRQGDDGFVQANEAAGSTTILDTEAGTVTVVENGGEQHTTAVDRDELDARHGGRSSSPPEEDGRSSSALRGFLLVERTIFAVLSRIAKDIIGRGLEVPLDPLALVLVWQEQRSLMQEREELERLLPAYGLPQEPLPPIGPIRRAMRHAFASYGSTLKDLGTAYGHTGVAFYTWLKMVDDITTVAIGDVAAAERHTAAAAAVAGLQRTDILFTQWTSAPFCPCSYVAADHAARWIVFAVRGSLHTTDALTNICADAVPFLDGYAHGGMLAAARRLANTCFPVVAAALRKYPEYDLIFTGHSLGGGVAVLLSMLLHHKDPDIADAVSSNPDWNTHPLNAMQAVRCYAFAPPSLVSLGLSQGCKEYVSSLICGKDCVPSLSVANAQRLLQRINRASSLNKTLRAVGDAWTSFTTQVSASIGALRSGNRALAPAPSEPTELQDHSAPEYLVPPGLVVHVTRPTDHDPVAAIRDPTAFSEIILSSHMISDHLPGVYLLALDKLYEMRRENGEEPVTTESLKAASRAYSFGSSCWRASDSDTSQGSDDDACMADVTSANGGDAADKDSFKKSKS
eukprot:jgi/Chlat1/452/Chrsp103S01067